MTATMRTYVRVFAIWFAVLFGAFWTYLAVAPINYLDAEYAIWAAKAELIGDRCAGEACPKVVILGDSRAVAGLDPALMREPAVNLALGGGTAMEAYFALTKYLKSHAEPSLLLVSISPYHFQESLFWERAARYHFLNPREQAAALADIQQWSNPALIDESDGRPVEASRLTSARYLTWFPAAYSASAIAAHGADRRAENLAIKAEVVTSRGHKFFGRADSNDERDGTERRPSAFVPAEVLDHYMERILEITAARGIPVRFYVMPCNPASFAIARGDRKDYIDGYHAYLKGFESRFAHFRVLNALGMLPADHFGDSSHVNSKGLAAVHVDLERRLESDRQSHSLSPESTTFTPEL